jgi:hypothetical protein
MFRFKDFNPAAVARLVQPPRKQISILQMLNNQKILKHFCEPRQAVAITSASRPFVGHLQWNGSDFQFNCPEGTKKILNKQLLVISFQLDGIEHYTQIEAKLIFSHHFIVAGLPSRYYKRFEILSPAWLHPVSSGDMTALIAGDMTIRRTQRVSDPLSGVHYFLREQIVKNGGEIVEDYWFDNAQILSGKLVEMSQGGCCLLTPNSNDEILRRTHLMYVTTTLSDGRKSGNIGCFAAIRKLHPTTNGLIARCSFFETMPLDFSKFKDITGCYELRFEESAQVILNGNQHKVCESFYAQMPQGYNFLHVKWARGVEVSYRILITPSSPLTFVISPDRGVVEQKSAS